ncbi:MAG: hypothetical protein IIA05_06375 [Proteobacteria bacterium]|nr:hypothetical protein [Pseudomonadota bacterium]
MESFRPLALQDLSHTKISPSSKIHTREHFWQASMAEAGIASMAAAAELFLAKLYGHDWNAHILAFKG